MKQPGNHGNPNWGKYTENRLVVYSLLGNKCAKCGTTERLEIDHIKRESKKYEVSQMLAISSPAELMEEIKKCQLLCHDHHMEKTIVERGQTVARGTHGTLSSYRYCRCELCTKAHSDYCLNWKKKNKANKKRRATRRRNGN